MDKYFNRICRSNTHKSNPNERALQWTERALYELQLKRLCSPSHPNAGLKRHRNFPKICLK